MKPVSSVAALAVWALPVGAMASPDMECGGSSQIEIADCLAKVEETVDGVVASALGFATASARELDQTTGRDVAVRALEAGQAAWSAYRDAHCEFIGATYGGGSGTGIAIRSCRIELGRARARALMAASR
ncbi:lysozyme inhibitor LprI family protein [Pukyongiella litopenaei]|nr:lysozyme inhibitor LprI family protein [Pukyongiella litopenaei]